MSTVERPPAGPGALVDAVPPAGSGPRVDGEPPSRPPSTWGGLGWLLLAVLVCVPLELGLAHKLAAGDPIQSLMRGELSGLIALVALLVSRLYLILVCPTWLVYRLLTLGVDRWSGRRASESAQSPST